jgi:hypothetical protein
MHKIHILRRQGGVTKDFNLGMSGLRLIEVYAYNVEPPLAQRWKAAQVLTGDRRDLAALVAVNGCLRSLHVVRSPRLNLYKTKNILLPANQVNFAGTLRRAEVARYDDVPQFPEMEVGFFFAMLANVLV